MLGTTLLIAKIFGIPLCTSTEFQTESSVASELVGNAFKLKIHWNSCEGMKKSILEKESSATLVEDQEKT